MARPSIRPKNVLLTLFASASVALCAPAPASAAACDKVASPSGSDAAQGTEVAPYRTVGQLADSLASGQTGCLRAGTFTEAVKVTSPGITLKSYAGERATLVGRLWVAANGVTVDGLWLDGTNSSDLPSPSVNAADVTFRNNDVTNNHTSICFSLGHPTYGSAVRTVIERNKIHNCGELPAANHDHGIYITYAQDTRIEGNWIYDNADRGIQVYPDSQRATIKGNVIDGNGQGVIFGGLDGVNASNNVVEGNIITNSKLRHNVESAWGETTGVGTGNVVWRNCVSGGARDEGNGGIADAIGFVASSNMSQDPSFVNRGGKDFRLAADSPCRSVYSNGDYIPGPDGSLSPSNLRRGGTRGRVTLSARPRFIRTGRRVRLAGRVTGGQAGGKRVFILARRNGHWRRVASARVRSNGRYSVKRRLRVRRGSKAVRLRAIVKRVGRSRSVRLRVRRR
jgi:parallel beta-helix repeat protein